jgi:hypothetical protein
MFDKQKVYNVPNKNTYEGFTAVRVIGEAKDLRGQQMVRVQALSGKPWWDQDGFTVNEKNYYPEFVKELTCQS